MLNIKYLMLVGGVTAALTMTGLTGCSWSREKEARETGRSTTQVADDEQITDNVSHALQNSPVYKYPDVGVSTFNRVVQLNGFVATKDQKRIAAEIAQQTPGVDRVINDIAVQPQPTAPTGRPEEAPTQY